MVNTDRLGPSPKMPNDGERDSLVGLYFRDASRYEMLTEASERRLSRKLTRCFRVISAELALPVHTSQTELARAMEASPSRIGELRALAWREVSTDVPMVADGAITLGDSLDAGDQAIPENRMSSRERVRQIEKLALRKLQALVDGPEDAFRP